MSPSAAENYAIGTAAAAERYAAAMAEARPKQLAALRREKVACVVPGCAKAASKGRLCRAHWEMVPGGDRMKVMLDAMHAQRRAADRAGKSIELLPEVRGRFLRRRELALGLLREVGADLLGLAEAGLPAGNLRPEGGDQVPD